MKRDTQVVVAVVAILLAGVGIYVVALQGTPGVQDEVARAYQDAAQGAIVGRTRERPEARLRDAADSIDALRQDRIKLYSAAMGRKIAKQLLRIGRDCQNELSIPDIERQLTLVGEVVIRSAAAVDVGEIEKRTHLKFERATWEQFNRGFCGDLLRRSDLSDSCLRRFRSCGLVVGR